MLGVITFSDGVNTDSDATPALRQTLERCRAEKARRLRFAPGRYNFHADRALEEYVFVSNNDEGLHRIIFPLLNAAYFEIDGQGSQFIFHGRLTPFFLRDCRAVKLRYFSIDWATPFHLEGRVLAVRDDGVDLHIPDNFSYQVDGHRLFWAGPGGDRGEFSNILEFDPDRRETAAGVWDNYNFPAHAVVQEIGPRQLRVTMPFKSRPNPGHILVFEGAVGRACPGIVLSGGENLTLDNVTIHHCGGMAVIAQNSKDISLQQVRVTPSPGRTISATADATHFVNCNGALLVEHCLFENQMDDAMNVHGIYGQLSALPSPAEIDVKLCHRQQWGFNLARPGDVIELVHADTMRRYHTTAVVTVVRLNKQFLRLTVESPPPAEARPGDAVNNLAWSTDVTVRHCHLYGNRARGLLISTPGRVRIQHNSFHVPGAAVLLAGDASFWFESGPVKDVVICNNVFDHCNFGVWGRAAIEIEAVVAMAHRGRFHFHHNIRIEANQFYLCDGRLIHAECVNGLRVRSNFAQWTKKYPRQHAGAAAVTAVNCKNVKIEAICFPAPAF